MKILKSVRLAPLTTFRIGGRADYFCRVQGPAETLRAIKWAADKKIPYRIFAGGSNVVFPDGKIKGFLIRIWGGRIETSSKNSLLVDAGAPLAAVVKKSINKGLKGLETLSGIPGTLGGAIVGNAGAYGHSIAEVVRSVEVWDPFGGAQGKGERRWLKNRGCHFAYRESIFKNKPYLILRVILVFRKGRKKELNKISKKIIAIRLKKYKPGLRCPGSFFKNVLVKDLPKKILAKVDKNKIIESKIPAGYLLEEAGARGMRLGGLKVANFHGNLLINQGGATASDVRRLAKLLKARVRKKFGIELQEEIRYF